PTRRSSDLDQNASKKMRFDTGIDLFFHFVSSNPDLLIPKAILSRGGYLCQRSSNNINFFSLPSDEGFRSSPPPACVHAGVSASPLECHGFARNCCDRAS